MASEAKVRGTLRFSSRSALEETLEALEDGDDLAEVLEAVHEGTSGDGLALELDLHMHLSNESNLELQEWLEDVAESAVDGYVNTWQEAFGDSMHVRLAAGGAEQEIDTPFPESGART